MEKQSMSSSFFSSYKIINIVVSGDEYEKIEKNKHQRCMEELLYQKKITMWPSFGLGVFHTETMKDHLSEDKVYMCQFCYRGFSSRVSLDVHQILNKENHSMSFSCFFSLQEHDDKIISVVVSGEVYENMKKKRYERNMEELLYQKAMYQNKITKRPSGLGVLHTETMKNHPSDEDKVHMCHFCFKVFPSGNALGGHQNIHRVDRELQKQDKEMESRHVIEGVYIKPSYEDKSHLGYGQQVLSNYHYNHLGVSHSGISNSVYPISSPWTSGPSFTESTICSSHALSNEINLDLTLGPSKSLEGRNNSSNVYSSFNGEVTRETKKLNLPFDCSDESLYHFLAGNPSSSHKNPPNPPQNTHLADGWLSLGENGASCSYSRSMIISKEKEKIILPEDDGKDIGKSG